MRRPVHAGENQRELAVHPVCGCAQARQLQQLLRTIREGESVRERQRIHRLPMQVDAVAGRVGRFEFPHLLQGMLVGPAFALRVKAESQLLEHLASARQVAARHQQVGVPAHARCGDFIKIVG